MSPVGRPEVGAPINIRLGDELLAAVDAYADVEGVSRAEAIRTLVKRGLPKRAKASEAEVLAKKKGVSLTYATDLLAAQKREAGK